MKTRWFAVGVLLSIVLAAPADLPRSTAESSNYTATTRYADVVAFGKAVAAQSPILKIESLGKSTEGRDLPLWVLADPQSARDGKLVVLLIGNIHAGEVDGKEALLTLARDIATGPDKALLKDLVILMAPIFNADGNERVSKNNRRDQAGPDEVGDRENAGGMDLNRDFVKLETPEVRNLVKAIRKWDPAIIADLHTTNGSHHRHVMTYDYSRNANSGRVAEIGSVFVPAAAERMKQVTNFVPFRYGNFSADRTRWESYPATPRYGIQYFGLRGKLGVLSESYAYAPYRERVRASLEFARGICQEAAARAGELKNIDSAPESPRLALRSRFVADGPKKKLLGYVEANGQRTDQTREYDVAIISKAEPTLEVTRPAAYVIAPKHDLAVECLQRHGVTMTLLREDVQMDVESYRIDRVDVSPRKFQGHAQCRLEATPQKKSLLVKAGSVLVRTNQKLGTLAGLFLEPQSEDGLATWNFFDDDLKVGADFPVLRLTSVPPLVTGELRPLPEDRVMNKPIDIPLAFGNAPPGFAGNPIRGITWLDAEHFLQDKEGKTWKVEARTGKCEPYLDTRKLIESLRGEPTTKAAADDLVNPGRLNMDAARTGALFTYRNDLYFAYFDGKPAVRVTQSAGPKQDVTLSPDGKRVAYTRGNNLCVDSIAEPGEKQLTSDASDIIRNGRADWVYEEELFNRNARAFWWSADGNKLAFLRFDDGPVHNFTVVNHLPTRLDVEKYAYPKAGDPNPHVKLALVDATGGTPRFVELEGYDPKDMLISRVDWLDADTAYAYVSNRTQTYLDVWLIPHNAPAQKLFRETTKAWVDDAGPLQELAGGDFLFLADRSGWRHLYRYSRDGTMRNAVTQGEWECRKVLRVDEAGGWVWFLGTKDSPTGENVYRAKLDGSALERITPEPGTHAAEVNPTCTLVVDTWSSLSGPTAAQLRAADGSLVRTLDMNPVYSREEYRFGKVQPVDVPLDGGFITQGIVIYPPDFKADKKYPVWVKTYAGPHAPTVHDSWNTVQLNDHLLASLGIVVFKVDPRAASGRGAQSAWTSYKQFGVQELKDLETAVDWLGTNSWVDRTRVGLSGHSFGGFITAYALTHSTKFCAGVSGAPVTDWRLYDSIYTERYMGLPSENKAGYDKTSVIQGAGHLHGKLLLIHGLMDDNVHLQNSVQFINALQRADKDFELMVYPTSRHGIIGRHYHRQVTNFICRSLALTDRVPERSGE